MSRTRLCAFGSTEMMPWLAAAVRPRATPTLPRPRTSGTPAATTAPNAMRRMNSVSGMLISSAFLKSSPSVALSSLATEPSPIWPTVRSGCAAAKAVVASSDGPTASSGVRAVDPAAGSCSASSVSGRTTPRPSAPACGAADRRHALDAGVGRRELGADPGHLVRGEDAVLRGRDDGLGRRRADPGPLLDLGGDGRVADELVLGGRRRDALGGHEADAGGEGEGAQREHQPAVADAPLRDAGAGRSGSTGGGVVTLSGAAVAAVVVLMEPQPVAVTARAQVGGHPDRTRIGPGIASGFSRGRFCGCRVHRAHWVGSRERHARVAERQTRWLQVPVSERAWGFKSPLAHQ